MRASLLVSSLTLAWAVSSFAAEKIPAEKKRAMDELWRRGHCMLSSVVVPAQRTSKVPAKLEGARVLDGRAITRIGGFSCFACDENVMWLATDARLDKVDLESRKRIASLTPADGLPNSPIEELILDGKTLWIVTRSGLDMLDTPKKVFRNDGLPSFKIAKVLLTPARVWVIADTGTHIFDRSSGTWHTHPAIPAARQFAAKLKEGIWRLRWKSATSSMIEDVALADGKVWVLSMGTLASIPVAIGPRSSIGWKQVTSDAWAIEADGDKLWVLTSKGVDCYTSDGVKHYASEDGLATGRHKLIAATDGAVWVATDPDADAEKTTYVGGGLSRFNKATGNWSNFTSVNGLPLTKVTYLHSHQGKLVVASLLFDKLVTLSAHPGMMHCKRLVPNVTGLAVHTYLAAADRWESVSAPLPEGEKRYVLGQKGTVHLDRLVPKTILGLTVTRHTLYCMFDMQPLKYYGGHCHSVGILARRESPQSPWVAGIENQAKQVGLEGEQPELLLVSESHGKRVVFAEGHRHALHLGVHGGRAWALSEEVLACESDAPGKWQKVVENKPGFYWNASAAAADADSVWIGGDAGTISRLDKRSLECEIIACLKGRKVTGLSLDGEGRLWVKSTAAKTVLPANLKQLPMVESNGLAVYDGKDWREAEATERVPADKTIRKYDWLTAKKGNFLSRRVAAANGGGEERFAYLRGVFKPRALCEDEGGKVLWLAIYEGLLRLDVSGD